MTREDDDTERNGKIIGWPLFADSGRREIDNHTMAREMQARVFNRSLHTLAALLNSGVGQANNGDTWQAIGIIDLHFNNDTFKTNYSTGIYTCKHERSVD